MTTPPAVEISTEEYQRTPILLTLKDKSSIMIYHYTPKKSPCNGATCILFHGFQKSILNPTDERLAVTLANLGYQVFGVDVRNHGNSNGLRYAHFTPDYFPKAMVSDIAEILEQIKKNEHVNPQKMAAIGFSYGGTIALSGVIRDKDIKTIISGCAVHDYQALWEHHRKHSSWQIWWPMRQVFFHRQNPKNFYANFQKVSPKYHALWLKSQNLQEGERKSIYLLHCKNDPIVLYDVCFLKNKADFGIPDNKTLIFEKGGHAFIGHHDEVLGKIIEWLHFELFENLN